MNDVGLLTTFWMTVLSESKREKEMLMLLDDYSFMQQ